MRRRDIPHSRERLRRRRKSTLWNIALVLFAVVLFVGTSAWILSDKRIRISRIEVEGNLVIQNHEIEDRIARTLQGKYLFLFPRDSIFLYPHDTIIKNLKDDLKRILTLDIRRSGLTALAVSIREREGAALWCGEEYTNMRQEKECYYLDQDGYIFARAPQFSGSVYFEFYGPREPQLTTEAESGVVTGSMFRVAGEFQRLIQYKNRIIGIGIPVYAMAALPFGDYELYMNDSGTILLNIKHDPIELASDLEAAYRAELGEPKNPKTREGIDYIDLRFENKVFFKRR